MIKRIRIDYAAKYRPGTPIIVCNARGKIIYERKEGSPIRKGRQWLIEERNHHNEDRCEATVSGSDQT